MIFAQYNFEYRPFISYIIPYYSVHFHNVKIVVMHLQQAGIEKGQFAPRL